MLSNTPQSPILLAKDSSITLLKLDNPSFYTKVYLQSIHDSTCILKIQSFFRRVLIKRRVVQIQSWWRCVKARRVYLQKRTCAIRIQKWWRCHLSNRLVSCIQEIDPDKSSNECIEIESSTNNLQIGELSINMLMFKSLSDQERIDLLEKIQLQKQKLLKDIQEVCPYERIIVLKPAELSKYTVANTRFNSNRIITIKKIIIEKNGDKPLSPSQQLRFRMKNRTIVDTDVHQHKKVRFSTDEPKKFKINGSLLKKNGQVFPDFDRNEKIEVVVSKIIYEDEIREQLRIATPVKPVVIKRVAKKGALKSATRVAIEEAC